ncbi:MAG: PSD1 and planctomycete cytochrome C domain-containing protein [Verrucomicrobiota bacterium]
MPFRSILLSLLSLPAPVLAEPVSFNRDIRPIMSDTCFHCHGFDPKSREAGLRLDVREDAIKPTSEGTIGIVPGHPEKSSIIQRLFDEEDPMPPKKSHKTLTAEQKELFRRWVAEGAVYEKHWAFAPIKKPEAPAGFTGKPAIDAFIQAQLHAKKLTPSPEAPKAKLLRRLSFDLIGLPPSLEEIAAFEQDTSPKAYEAQVERLLASKHYGERWGRWWLDQARYADSNGYSVDAPRQIWKFRDWVIDALNQDMPFDQFTVEQLAGDLLPKATESQRIATGFHRNTQINEEGGIDKEQFRIESVFDRVATTGTVWLGLTIGCAQCHDHKFDPIEHKEYYQFFAFLNSQEEPVMKISDPRMDVTGMTKELKGIESQLKTMVQERGGEIGQWEKEMTAAIRGKLSARIKKILAKPVAKRSLSEQLEIFSLIAEPGEDLLVLNERRKELDAKLSKGTTTLVMKELATPRLTNIFIKGDFTRPDAAVTPGTPKVLPALRSPQGHQPNRLDLARWIMSPENPLTARVIVNRVWQQYFGRGIVETENDFGSQGTPPSHPELLDWLASEFMAQKWSLKAMHRLIVTSHTYKQSSDNRPELIKQDPGNYLLARQTRLRLDGELVRDACLSASGLLSPKMGGAPVYPPIPDGVMGQGQVKRVWTVSQGEDRYRRSLYTFIYRASPPPWLTVFDTPEGITTCTRRLRSNTPLQSLTLLNDQGFLEFAIALEKIIRKDGLEVAFCRCTSRLPKPDELSLLKTLDPLNAARVLLNLDETVTRE